MNKEILKQEQPIVFRILSNALKQGKLSHAYLFSGPMGSPKEETALLVAQSILCDHRDSDGFACQQCENCKRIEKEESLDFHWIHKGEERIKKQDILDLQDFFSQTSTEIKGQRVFILEHFDQATPDAANSLLKFLEEPTPGITGILTSNDRGNVLPTIVSRCQNVTFRPANKKRLRTLFQEESALVEELLDCGYSQIQIQELLQEEDTKFILQEAKEYTKNWKNMSAILHMQTKVFVPKQERMKKEKIRLWLQSLLVLVHRDQVMISQKQKVELIILLSESLDTLARPVDLALFLDGIYAAIYQIVTKGKEV